MNPDRVPRACVEGPLTPEEVERAFVNNQRRTADNVSKGSPKNPDDPVNHPAHYTQHPSGVECIRITEHMNFCLGNAVKYIWRAGLKSDNPIQDLEKARWYLQQEIDRIRRG